jgi:D-alanyl-D-alanine carboxypeptidase/D-alanyl-D-alanine-endopeptidase (penicillin-binding protein 4)
MALTLATDENEIMDLLRNIRYKDGIIDYSHRKHYLVADGLSDARFVRMVAMTDDTVSTRIPAKNEFFKRKNLKYLVNGQPAEDPVLKIHNLPYKKAIKWAGTVYEGPMKVYGVALVGATENLDASHTGFVVLRPGEKALFRHASTNKQVLEVPLKEYLEGRSEKSVPGVAFFEIVKK